MLNTNQFTIKPVRATRKAGISLVALMDIFTVLVFFLIFNVHEEQALQIKNVKDLPVSSVMKDMDSLRKKEIAVLEVIDKKKAFLNDKELDMTKGLTVIKEHFQNLCNETQCPALAIEAPKAMSYPFINQFVNMGYEIGFNGVFLIVSQQ
ncbi:biopolymer transporter ExbD [uncultured Shewanella sp.]|uniref:biopolymer transporter ExbD n=1 Tax=uncultured Shewanella sp. TaxID=173975 RepID=UPI00260963D7|nr:biopolymer transporter ExbD [uncultured Shewanella sp.]